ncbi:DUF6660 family protein (plasmid) [Fibrella sp. ES10-3-2-2]
MKWLTTILAFYLLTLSLWPCADEAMPVCSQSAVGAVSVTHSSDVPASHQHDYDQCTPFCICSCCATSIIAVPHFSYALVTVVRHSPITTSGFNYVPVQWASPLSAIWQPPQLRV